MSPRPQIAIVGPGRLGQALGRLLNRTGFKVGLVAARRPAAARRAARFVGAGRAVPLDSPELTDAAILLLTVSDSALGEVARDLASRRDDWSGRVILHTCGSLPASILQPFRRRGAAAGCIHPFQTVPSPEAGVRNLVGCYWAIEGDRNARRLARRWVRALKGVSFAVHPEKKTLYHLSAFLTCPTIVTLMNFSARLLRVSGVQGHIARPMLADFVRETARNFEDFGARRSLTGPAARGDWTTLRRHLAALRRFFPQALPTYKALVRAMLMVAGRLPPWDLGRELKP